MTNPVKNYFAILLFVLLSGKNFGCRAVENPAKKTQWEILSADRWRGINSESFPSRGWIWKGNTLTILKGGKGGDIVTKEKYRDFELVLEFNLTPAANSGIKYFVELIKSPKNKSAVGIGPEYQVIDDYTHESLKDKQYSSGSSGALYLIYEPSKDKILRPSGKWNKVSIIAKGKHIEHWLNGKKILSYERGTEEFRKLVGQSKFKDVANYGEADEGYILLQEHQDEVSFRNIKIRRL